MTVTNILYIADGDGRLRAVVVPIETWREIESELETQHLLGSEPMRRRLLETFHRERGVPFGDALSQLGIDEDDDR